MRLAGLPETRVVRSTSEPSYETTVVVSRYKRVRATSWDTYLGTYVMLKAWRALPFVDAVSRLGRFALGPSSALPFVDAVSLLGRLALGFGSRAPFRRGGQSSRAWLRAAAPFRLCGRDRDPL